MNKKNIEKCFDILVDIGYSGIASMECEGKGGPMIEKSLVFMRRLVNDTNRRMAAKR